MSKTKNQKAWTIKTSSEALGWSMNRIYQKAEHHPSPIVSVNKGLHGCGDDQLEAIAKIVGENPGRSRRPKGGAK